MINTLLRATFGAGAIAIIWMAALFWHSDQLALTITLIIAIAYLIGVQELRRFRQASANLMQTLENCPAQLDSLSALLQQLQPALQNPVRMRIEGERVALPAPVLTPYLTGLLVMLGLLGTFFGMVDTLKGAVSALQGSSELQAIRAGLAAPINGLSVAFGTSVAGVAASATLGLMATLARHERSQAIALLDRMLDGVFKPFSLAYNRQQTFAAMQQQAHSLPDAAKALAATTSQLDAMGQRLEQSLLANQTAFAQRMEQSYQTLNTRIQQALEQSLQQQSQTSRDMAQQTGTALLGMLQSTVNDIQEGLGSHLQHSRQQLNALGAEQIDAINEQLRRHSEQINRDWQQQLHSSSAQLEQRTEQHSEQILHKFSALMQACEALVERRVRAEADWLTQQQQQLQALSSIIRSELGSLREQEQQQRDAALQQLQTLEGSVAQHLLALGQGLEAPITRMLAVAEQVPQSAAELMQQWQQQLSAYSLRDKQLLEERRHLSAELEQALIGLQRSSTDNQQAIAQLTQTSTQVLTTASAHFSEQLAVQSEQLDHSSARLLVSATQIDCLGDSFSQAISQFDQSNQQLVTQLQQIEQALDLACNRSDEQMGYYVAQARDIIDHSIGAQQQILQSLHRLQQPAPSLSEQAD